MKPLSQAAGENIKDRSLNRTQARQLFVSAALDMSWRLAIVVLVPIIGGVELDKAFKSTPLFTFVGLVVAMILTALVVARALKAFAPPEAGGVK